MAVSCECCVLSGRGLCDGPIFLLEESYREKESVNVKMCVFVGVCVCASLGVTRCNNPPLKE